MSIHQEHQKKPERRVLGVIKKIGLRGLFIGLACGAAAWLAARIPIVSRLEQWLQDGRFFARGVRQTQTKVIVIGLDEDFIAHLQGPLLHVSPQIAEVVTYLSKRKAAAIGLDFWISQDKFGEKELEEGGKGDATKLGDAIADADAAPVVLAEMKMPKGWLQPLPQWRFKEFRDQDPTRLDRGFVNVTEDADNVVRRQHLAMDGHTDFALALYARARHSEVVWANGGLSVGSQSIPLDAEGKLVINFVGPPETFATIPFREVLAAARNERFAPVDFADAIVIIGATAPSLRDLHVTPWANLHWGNFSTHDDRLMSGPEVQANIIATIGDGAFVRSVEWLTSFSVILILGGVLGVSLEQLSGMRGNLWLVLGGPVLLVLFCSSWDCAGSTLFCRSSLRIEAMPLFIVAFLTYIGTLAMQRLVRSKRRRWGGIKIFVSYRRDDSRHIAERIYSSLAAHFGKDNVFKDIDSIGLGLDFRPELETAVSDCTAMVAVIGPRWLTIAGNAGQRRLDDASDFVRIELERALARSIPVIPVLVDGATMPKPTDLPLALQPLLFRQGTQVRTDPDFRSDMERLLAALSHAKRSSGGRAATRIG